MLPRTATPYEFQFALFSDSRRRLVKYSWTIFAAMIALAAPGIMAEPSPDLKSPAAMMRAMRLKWLTTKPHEAGNTRESEPDKVSAVLMDWPLGEQVITVLASSAGDGSIYTTGTFGIIGGIGHENVRKAAISLIHEAQADLALSTPTTDFSYPTTGHIRFFFVLLSGVQSVTFPAADVEKPDTAARALYAKTQQVLTELRLTTQPGTPR